MTEQRNTSAVLPTGGDLFRQAKDQIDLLSYLADRHKALDGQFPAHFQKQAQVALGTLSAQLGEMWQLFKIERGSDAD